MKDQAENLDGLLPAILLGDLRAFGTWLSSTELPLLEYLSRWAERMDAEIAFQETMLRVWQVAPRVRLEEANSNTLLEVAARIAVDVGRLEAGEREAPPPMSMPVVVGRARDESRVKRFEELRSNLTETETRVFSARSEAAGVHPDERIAVDLGLSRSEFLLNASSARRKLSPALRSETSASPDGGGLEIGPDERLVEAVLTSHRTKDALGRGAVHPAWLDLDFEGRRLAFAAMRELRALEAMSDVDGLSTSARAVLRKIQR